jgi:hypothetical protein
VCYIAYIQSYYHVCYIAYIQSYYHVCYIAYIQPYYRVCYIAYIQPYYHVCSHYKREFLQDNYVKLKLSLAGLNRSLALQEVEAPRISRQSAHKVGKAVSHTHRPPLPLLPSQETHLVLISVKK